LAVKLHVQDKLPIIIFKNEVNAHYWLIGYRLLDVNPPFYVITPWTKIVVF
jgi:hypothetical protein